MKLFGGELAWASAIRYRARRRGAHAPRDRRRTPRAGVARAARPATRSPCSDACGPSRCSVDGDGQGARRFDGGPHHADCAFVPSAVQGWVRRWLAELRVLLVPRASPTPTSSAPARRRAPSWAAGPPRASPSQDGAAPTSLMGGLGHPPIGQVSAPISRAFSPFSMFCPCTGGHRGQNYGINPPS